jgi:hypothetical protein
MSKLNNPSFSLIVLEFLFFTTLIYSQNVVLTEIDLSKGNAGTGVVTGGRFDPKGWTPMEGQDNIGWVFSNIGPVDKGYITVTMTNLNPKKQATSQNQFLGINEKCDGSGVKVRIRMGKGYEQFKLELHDGVKTGLGSWDEPRIDPLTSPFDTSKIYQWKFQWDTSGLKILFNDKVTNTKPWKVKGFCNLRIGETWYPSLKAFRGPIYTKIEYVSQSGTPAAPTNPPALSHAISLKAGWNLMSIPLQPENPSISTVLDAIKSKFLAVYSYNGGSYTTYIPDSEESDLTQIVAGKGYWIYMQEAATLNVTGLEPKTSIPLSTGWNLIGYNLTSRTTISQSLSSLAGKYEVIYAFDSEKNSFIGYDPASSLKDFTELMPGLGYWIYMSQPASLLVSTPN